MSGWLREPPVLPTSEEGRRWLREELRDPDYHDRPLLERVVDWLVRTLASGVERAGTIPPLSVAAAVAVFFALAVAAVILLGRVRRDRGRRTQAGPALTDEAVTAAQLRRRADRALADGRHGEAVIDGFRALALREQETGRLHAAPGATAHEIAAALGRSFPALAGSLEDGARTFEEVRYGDRPAGPDRAAAILTLDDELARSRSAEVPA